MRLLYLAIFVATVACITEFVLKFTKVRISTLCAPDWPCVLVCQRLRIRYVLRAGELPAVCRGQPH